MSKIIISGYGYVGKATHRYLIAAGVDKSDIVINDPPLNHKVDDWSKAEWHFVCVPTPSVNENDVSPYQSEIVLDTIDLSFENQFNGTTVIRSTLDPESMRSIHHLLSDGLIVWPEFLRKATWENDAVNPIINIAGGAKVHLLNDLFSQIYRIVNVFETPIEACITKLSINSLLASRTIQAYNIKTLCDKMDVSYKKIADIIYMEPRLGNSHWDQPGPDGQYGYGGSCFPKDTSAMAFTMKNLGIENSYAEWAHNSNVKIKDGK